MRARGSCMLLLFARVWKFDFCEGIVDRSRSSALSAHRQSAIFFFRWTTYIPPIFLSPLLHTRYDAVQIHLTNVLNFSTL
ncbi:hypothetical protein F4806DRAFT_458541 [Annulohypoxylon nitens]|nr:hypothetical protein F4806DRAFT_458541 [Annulohypoxylon nitens]